MPDITAVVLAGGFGTRVRHLLPELPKPMAEACGRPFVEWVVRFLARQGINRVILSTGYLAHVIERHFAANPVPGVQTRCAPEIEPLGTAGGFLHAVRESAWESPSWLVLNGDSLCFFQVTTALRQLNSADADALIVGFPMEDAARYGTLQVGSGAELLSFQEKRPGRGIINAGLYLFRGACLSRFPNTTPLSFETQVFPALAEQKARIDVHVAPGPFLDIGTPESLREAARFIDANRVEFA